MAFRYLFWAVAGSFFILLCGAFNKANAKVFNVYHDADYSLHESSAKAMKMGFLTALDEFGGKVQGIDIKLVEKNHRGNIKRSLLHMKQFLADPDALLVFGGLHSPPYISNRTFINENSILLMVPWAAGGPVTRYGDGENWVYRLSIDDTKAGIRLADFALKQRSCEKPLLVLEETPWGKSNEKTMAEYLQGKLEFDVHWFGWNTKKSVAKITLRNAIANKNDCILLVANYRESGHFFNAMMEFPSEQRLPFISHWGFTGGNIDELISSEMRSKLDLSFIQSCFSYQQAQNPLLAKQVYDRASKLFPEEFADRDKVASPAGFVHGYDLAKIIFTALSDTHIGEDIASTRAGLRNKLESLSQPIEGLIKTYKQPYSRWHQDRQDAHEALKLEDFCMARFAENNQIVIQSTP